MLPEVELSILREFAAFHAHLVHEPKDCLHCAYGSGLWHDAHPDAEDYREPDKKFSVAFAPTVEDAE